jgi:hypothetical protein
MANNKLISKYKKRLKMEKKVLSEAITCEQPNIEQIKGIHECIGIYRDFIKDLKRRKKKKQ